MHFQSTTFKFESNFFLHRLIHLLHSTLCVLNIDLKNLSLDGRDLKPRGTSASETIAWAMLGALLGRLSLAIQSHNATELLNSNNATNGAVYPPHVLHLQSYLCFLYNSVVLKLQYLYHCSGT